MSQAFYTNLRKIAVWGVALFFLAVLQTSLFARVAEVIPRGAVPDLLLAASVAIAIFDSERTGAIAGIAAGFLAGALGGVGFSLLPLCYMLCAYVCGIWSTMSLSANLPSWIVYMLASGVARAIVSLVHVAVVYGDYRLSAVVGTVLLPEFFSTLVCSFLVYFPLKRLALLCNRRLKIPE